MGEVLSILNRPAVSTATSFITAARPLHLLLSLAVFAMGAAGFATAAAAADDNETCYKAADDASIAACTSIISSGTLKGADLAKAFLSRAQAWQKKGQDQNAINDFDQVTQLDPNNVSALNSRGNSYQALGQFARAIQDYQRAVELDPKNSVIFYNMGLAYSAVHDFQHALDDYDRGIQLDPKDVSAYNNRCYVYNMMKSYDRAILDCDEAIKLNHNYPKAYLGRGNAYRYKGDYDRAIENYSTAIQWTQQMLAPFWVAASPTSIRLTMSARLQIIARQ